MAPQSNKGVVFGISCGVALSLLLAGCGGGSGQGFNSTTTARNTLIGTWTKSGISGAGQSITCPNSLTQNSIVVDSCVAGETIQFGSDGTYTITDPATKFGVVYVETGTYALSGSSLTLTRRQTNIINGVVTPGAAVTLPSPVVIPNTLSQTSTDTFTLQPAVPAAGAGYTVAETSDGTTTVSTYTRN